MQPSDVPAWRRLIRFRDRDRDISDAVDDELRFHLEMRAQELALRGMSDADAHRAANARFGNIDGVRQACEQIGLERARAERRRASLVDFGQDIAYALRVLRRQPLPAAIIVLCLALGIGAATTVFSVGDALLLRPPPFPNGPRLVVIGPARSADGRPGVASFEDFFDWRARQRTFDEIGAIQRETYAVRADHTTRIAGAAVTSSLFRVLGVRPLRGRLFAATEDVPGASGVAVVSATFADRVLGGVDRAVGTTLRLTHRSLEVVGVLDAASQYPDGVEVWTSMPRVPIPEERHSRSMELIGALRSGTTPDAARRDLAAVNAQLVRDGVDLDSKVVTAVVPLRDRYVGAARPAFAAIAAAAALLLLIACANVASLQLARASARVREVAVRSALGAGRGRLIRLLLTESVILAIAGGAAGVWAAVVSTGVVTQSIPTRQAPWMTPSIDLRVLGFTLAVATLCGLIFGLVPALRLAGLAPAHTLRGGTRGGLDPRRLALQRGFVAIQLAMSLVLLVGASMAARSFQRLTTLDPGFDPTGVATFRVSLRDERYAPAESRAQFAEDVVRELKALPGVAAAAAASHVPIADCCSRFGLHVEGEPRDRTNEHLITGNVVTPEYFRALGIELVRGRAFTDADRLGAQHVVLINERFERELFHGSNALGRIVHLGSRDAVVVGVVRDVKQTSFTDAPEPQLYQPQSQVAWDDLTFAVRLSGGMTGTALFEHARRIVGRIDASMPLYRPVLLTDVLHRAVTAQRMFRTLLLGFALIALVLAIAGIYGVTSYYVAQRLPDMGIRLALGARPGALLSLVLRQGATLVAVGLAAGLAGAAIAVRFLSRLLYDVRADESIVFVSAAAVLALTTLMACLVPARRATRADPMVTLRSE